jgi:cytochrome c553
MLRGRFDLSILLSAGLLPALLAAPAAAGAGPDARAAFFETRIRPVLVNRCGACHGEKVQSAGLRLTTRAGLLKGGQRGAAIVAGQPEKSRLIQAVRRAGPLKMPPAGPLPAAEIEALEKWVADGAAWPEYPEGRRQKAEGSKPPTAAPEPTHWAFQPVKRTAPPAVKDQAWPRGPIDRFVLRRLEQKGIAPVRDADRLTLLRRVTLDLTGLLPTLEELEAFQKDESPGALERVVDRLLASPAFGERWGRHWLDVTYWADTTGAARRVPLPDAWRYRDYVIEAFNQDRPYNQFVKEQLAGDALRSEDEEARAEQLTATGFLVLGPWQLFNGDKEQMRMDIVDLQIDLVGRTFLGLTTGCARCHDHKFDPIPTRDYYALAGIFRSTQTIAGTRGGWSALNRVEFPADAADLARYAEQLGAWEKELADLGAKKKAAEEEKARLTRLAADLKAAATAASSSAPPAVEGESELTRVQKELEAVNKTIGETTRRLNHRNALKPERPGAYAAQDAPFGEDARINLRGNVRALGDEVPRGFLQVLSHTETRPMQIRGSGRRELAEWVAHPQNPLTARVYVNRLWRHLFGTGLVATVDNFGTRGEAPSHPELLDYLAGRLVEHGWSTKKTLREIVLSRTYGLSAETNASAQEADPENRLLWRAKRRRLEAEAIRDTLLQVSGRLNPTRGGPTLPLTEKNLFINTPNFLEDHSEIPEDVFYRRAVYQPIFRGSLIESLDVLGLFDFADPDQVVGERSDTTVPLQTLYLMNAPFMKEQARRLAERLLADAALDDAGRIDRLHRLALSRPATDEEQRQGSEFIAAFQAELKTPDAKTEAWARYCHAILASTEFLYRR